MSLIVYKVTRSLNRWAITHNDVTVATFSTREDAEKAALAIGALHTPRDTAELDLIRGDGPPSEIRIF